MHELSIALSILDLATEEAEQRGVRVRGIHLRMGPLCGVVKEALVSAYEVAREEYPLNDAQLVIEEVPVQAYCPSCQTNRAVVSLQQLCCSECGMATPQVVTGRELEIVALEIQ